MKTPVARAGALFAFVLVVVAALLIVPAVPAHADVPSTGRVLFQDDFGGAANAAPGSWWYDYSTCTYDATAAWGSIDCGVDETLDGDGHLVVPADATHGSALRTHQTFLYGTMTARMKLPPTEGYWPAFWTLNNDPAGGQATASTPVGEVDGLEAFTKWTNVYHGVGHTWTGDGATDFHSADNRCPATEDADLTAWHDYSAKIEPGKVTFYFDGVQCGGPYAKTTGEAWGFGPDVTRGNFLILTNAVGGAGGQQATPSQADNVLVDRVEVRALDSTVTDNGTYKIVNPCGGKVLSAPDGNAGTQLATADWTGADAQKWTTSVEPDGTWKIKNVSDGHTVNVDNASTSSGAHVIQWSDNGGLNAEWTFADDGNNGYRIASVNSSLNLAVPGDSTAANVGLEQATPGTSCGQSWQLTAV